VGEGGVEGVIKVMVPRKRRVHIVAHGPRKASYKMTVSTIWYRTEVTSGSMLRYLITLQSSSASDIMSLASLR
jgi:hypothetical protein